jgi:hypothetical protein
VRVTPAEAKLLAQQVKAALTAVDLPADAQVLLIVEFEAGEDIMQCMAMPKGGDALGMIERALKQIIGLESGSAQRLSLDPS